MRTRRIKMVERPKSPNEMNRAPLIFASLSQCPFSIKTVEIFHDKIRSGAAGTYIRL